RQSRHARRLLRAVAVVRAAPGARGGRGRRTATLRGRRHRGRVRGAHRARPRGVDGRLDGGAAALSSRAGGGVRPPGAPPAEDATSSAGPTWRSPVCCSLRARCPPGSASPLAATYIAALAAAYAGGDF